MGSFWGQHSVRFAAGYIFAGRFPSYEGKVVGKSLMSAGLAKVV